MLSPTGSSPNYKGKRIGLIFEGSNVVGTFEGFTGEDCNGQRSLTEVHVYTSCIDIVKARAKKPLQFLFAEVLDYDTFKFRQIEDFGFGVIEDPEYFWADTKYCSMNKIKWSKCPASYCHAN